MGRIVTGVGVGCGFVVAPVYIAEITPPHVRGRLTALTGKSSRAEPSEAGAGAEETARVACSGLLSHFCWRESNSVETGHGSGRDWWLGGVVWHGFQFPFQVRY